MDSCLLPCLTYVRHMRHICQWGMERSILNIILKNKIWNIDLRTKTKAFDARRYARRLK